MNNMNNILNAIRAIDNFNDLDRIFEEVKQQNGRINRMKTKAFVVGDYVYFTDRSGGKCYGYVTKVNQRTLKVQVANTLWTVDASLVSKDDTQKVA